MVVKIHKSRPSISGSLEYNERKVEAGKAEKVFLSKINDPNDPMATFDIYERANIKTKFTSFHVSFNPDKTDRMTEEETINFIKDWMAAMGYADQPYIIYKHHDIDRAHYHLVSTRIKLDGHRIYNGREYIRSQKALQTLSEKYGFTIGHQANRILPATNRVIAGSTRNPIIPNSVMPDLIRHPSVIPGSTRDLPSLFDPTKGDITAQIKAIATEALKYHFTTKNQLKYIFEDYRVQLEFKPGKHGTTQLVFRGLGNDGRPCTNKITGEQLQLPSYADIEAQMQAAKQSIKKKEITRVDNLANFAATKARHISNFENILRKKGISVHYSLMSDGKIHGLTFIDHATRCAFKASELKTFKLQMIEHLIVTAPQGHFHRSKISKTVKSARDLIKSAMDASKNDKVSNSKDQQYNEDASRHKRTIYG